MSTTSSSSSSSSTPSTPCPSCEGHNDADARFCKHCGHQLPAQDACASCGGVLDEDARFCKHCGVGVGDAASAKEPAKAKAPKKAAPKKATAAPKAPTRPRTRRREPPARQATGSRPPIPPAFLVVAVGVIILLAVIYPSLKQDNTAPAPTPVGSNLPNPNLGGVMDLGGGGGGGGGGGVSSAQDIQGTVVVAPNLQQAIPPAGTLYIMARLPEAPGGPPLAAARIPASPGPTPFSIGPKDMMMGPGDFSRPVLLSVRWDQDGDASSKEPGDLVGVSAAPVTPGSKGVTLTLSQRHGDAGGGATPPPTPTPAPTPNPHTEGDGTEPPAAPSNQAPITGAIRIDDALKASTPAAKALFLIARPVGVTSGPPLASARLTPSTEGPIPFSLGPSNLMMGGVWGAPIQITARWDQDGDAMTRQAGDLTGTTATSPSRPGDTNVEILLKDKHP